MAIYKTIPLVDKTIWGGNTLNKLRNNTSDNGGTSWEISFHEYGPSPIVGNDKNLLDLLNENQKDMIGSVSKEKVLRLAYLDSKEPLSIQLHPTLEYSKNISDYGKYEAWYILEAKPGAKLIAGTSITDKEALEKAIKDLTIENHLIYHEVKAGDFIYIPAGCIHGLGADILAIEVSTNSNTTYRVYDYDRRDSQGNPRQLHISEVLANVDLSIKPKLIHTQQKIGEQLLIENDHFKVECVDVIESYTKTLDGNALYITSIGGDITLESETQELELKLFDNVFVSSSTKKLGIKGRGRLLISQVSLKEYE